MAFDELKKRLTEAPILAYPDFSKPFKLACDACDTGLGVVLKQTQADGKDHPLAYASSTLIKAERNYSTSEKEALCLVWGCNYFKNFLVGQKVILTTDHAPLRFLKTNNNPNSRLQRWSIFLNQFQIQDIVYVAGKSNGDADGLSRAPLPVENTEEFDNEILMLPEEEPEQCQLVKEKSHIEKCLAVEHFPTEERPISAPAQLIGAVLPYAPPNVRKLQRKDPDFAQLINYHENKTTPADTKLAELIFTAAEKSCLQDGTLYFVPKQKKAMDLQFHLRLAVPAVLRAEIMEGMHDDIFGGHLGFEKTLEKITTRFYWPNMSQNVKDYCEKCHLCATRKGVKLQRHAPLSSMPNYKIPFQRLAVDMVGPLHRTYEGHVWILVFTDFASRWPECFPLKDAKAQTIARVFVEEIVCRHGAPLELLSDRGTNFLAAIVRAVCELCQTRKIHTCGYAPQTNGLCENFNKTLINMLSMYCNTMQDDWHRFIPFCLFSYHTSVQKSTRFTPAQLLYGRNLRFPIDACFQQPRNPNFVHDDDYPRLMQNWLTEARQCAELNNLKAKEGQKIQFDKHVKPINNEIGQQVYIYTPVKKTGFTHKFLHEFSGPYVIIKVFLPKLLVQSVDHPRQKQFWVHSTRVKISHLEKLVPNKKAPVEDENLRPKIIPAKVKTPEIEQTTPAPLPPTVREQQTAGKPEIKRDTESEAQEKRSRNKPETQHANRPSSCTDSRKDQKSEDAPNKIHNYNLRQRPQMKKQFLIGATMSGPISALAEISSSQLVEVTDVSEGATTPSVSEPELPSIWRSSWDISPLRCRSWSAPPPMKTRNRGSTPIIFSSSSRTTKSRSSFPQV